MNDIIKWGPWTDSDFNGCPVQVGQRFQAYFDFGKEKGKTETMVMTQEIANMWDKADEISRIHERAPTSELMPDGVTIKLEIGLSGVLGRQGIVRYRVEEV